MELTIKPPFDHSDCGPDAHDRRSEGTHPDEQKVDAEGKLACNDCDEPMFYCRTTAWYHHVNPEAAPCFLTRE